MLYNLRWKEYFAKFRAKHIYVNAAEKNESVVRWSTNKHRHLQEDALGKKEEWQPQVGATCMNRPVAFSMEHLQDEVGSTYKRLRSS